MEELQVIEHQNQRVLTSAQLAESFGTDSRNISKNYTRNAHRYVYGKHYFSLEGEEKRSFLNRGQIDDGSKNAAALYLWTEKGAWMHAKSLNTDQAWEAYERLVDDYYEVKEQQIDVSQLSPEMQMFHKMFQSVAKVEMKQLEQQRQIEEVNNAVQTIQETFLERDPNWRKSVNSMLNKAAFQTNEDYRNLRNRSYDTLQERAHCKLDRRLTHYLQRLEDSGATKTQIRQANKMDIIEVDPRLKEIYATIVKELSIGSLSLVR